MKIQHIGIMLADMIYETRYTTELLYRLRAENENNQRAIKQHTLNLIMRIASTTYAFLKNSEKHSVPLRYDMIYGYLLDGECPPMSEDRKYAHMKTKVKMSSQAQEFLRIYKSFTFFHDLIAREFEDYYDLVRSMEELYTMALLLIEEQFK